MREYDVLVIGGGNAGLCAAITARMAGATVLLLESAPKAVRGGNSRHTRNFRVMHNGPEGVLSGSYCEEEYWEDLLRVTAGRTDETLARLTICETEPMLAWMSERGVHFQPPLQGTLSLSRTNAFFFGGGKALVNAYYAAAERAGVHIRYDSEVTALAWVHMIGFDGEGRIVLRRRVGRGRLVANDGQHAGLPDRDGGL